MLIPALVVVALVGYKACRIVWGRIADRFEEARPPALPLPPRKPTPPLHFVNAHPRVLLTGARRDRLKAALASPAGARFKTMVDSQMGGEKQEEFRGHYAAFLYNLTGDARYATYAVSVVDAFVTGEERKIARGEEPEAAFDSYLLVGDLIGDVALTYDWCFDRLSESQKKRWLAYADQAVWNVWNARDASWGGKRHKWSGWATNNPKNNYYSSFLEATMLLGLAARGELPRAADWVKEFRDRQIGDSLLRVYERDLGGGGSREGTGYGLAMRRLFRLYDFWESATGERLAALTSHARESLLYSMHATVPTLDRMAPIGDQARESKSLLFDYHREYVQVLMYLFRNDPTAAVAQSYLAQSSVPKMTQSYTYLFEVLYGMPELPQRPLKDLHPTYHGKGTGHVFARSGWDTGATWLGFIAGAYDESHAHQDQGSFLIFKDEWLAIDEVIESRSGLRGEAPAHNLVALRRGSKQVEMEFDRTALLLALADSPQYTYVAADVTPMYQNQQGVELVQRELVFVKPDTFVVFDRVNTSARIQKTWHLSTPVKPTTRDNYVSIQGAKHNLTVTAVLPRRSRPAVVAWKGLNRDLNGGYRIDITSAGDGLTSFLTVLSLDGAVSKISEASGDGDKAVALVLKDGRAVTARFSDGGVGGSLELRTATGKPVKVPLAAGVATLPVLAK